MAFQGRLLIQRFLHAGDLASSDDEEGRHLSDFIGAKGTLEYLKKTYVRNLDDSNLVFSMEDDREDDGTWDSQPSSSLAL